METIYFKGTPCHTYGNIPVAGEKAPCYNLGGVDQERSGRIIARLRTLGKPILLTGHDKALAALCDREIEL